jgi:hypothetical protein
MAIDRPGIDPGLPAARREAVDQGAIRSGAVFRDIGLVRRRAGRLP